MNILGYIAYVLVMWIILFALMRLKTVLKIKRKGSYKEYAVPVRYIEKRFKLKIGETRSRTVGIYLDLINSLAVVLPIMMFIFIDLKMNMALQYALTIALFILVILGGYTLLGYILKRKENKDGI